MSLTIDIRAVNSFSSVVIKIKRVFPIVHVAHRASDIKNSSLMIVVEGNELTIKKSVNLLSSFRNTEYQCAFTHCDMLKLYRSIYTRVL